jgi:general secretion pathway protein K
MKSKQKGVAIISAVFIITLIVWIASELAYETSVEYSLHARSIQKLQAYYTARSGIELSLLRLMIYKKAKAQFGNQLGPQSAILNKIWSFPLIWPPVLGDNISSVDRVTINQAIEESTIKGSFVATIFDEGSKIDINDLGSPSEKIREITSRRVTQMLQEKMRSDPDFADLNRNTPIENLVAHIRDWIDADQQSSLGGDERSFYPNSNRLLPPNRAFRSLDELQLVATMTPSIFEFLKNKVTVYGQKAINPNTASAELLKSLDVTITDEVVSEILARRDNIQLGGPFQSVEDFWSFANSRGARVTTEKQAEIPMIFDNVMSFRIQSSAEYKGNNHTIEIVVWDYPQIVNSLAEQVSQEITGVTGGQGNNPGQGVRQTPPGNSTSGQSGEQRQDNHLPPIVYWIEK